MSLRTFLFGRPLTSAQQEAESLGSGQAIAILGLDGLASAAYGPEATLTVLLPVGAAALHYIGPLTAGVVVLLVLVHFSYRQTIIAYPNGGGAYTVARENLGQGPALLAASALALDYIMNVAVGVAAGVGALVSAAPRLLPYTLPLCLAMVAILALVNLRGVRTAGAVFTFPTYLFLVCLGATCLWGLSSVAWGATSTAHAALESSVPSTTASLWLLARAFSSGCTAMTGVEALSNAVPVFHKPAVPRARFTLSAIITLLVGLLVGVAFLTRAFGVTATPPGQAGFQSVLSQVVMAVAGRGAFYYVTMASVVAVLCLSANTSFAGFPRLCRVLAQDDFLPSGFAHRGRRLVYSYGIVLLTVVSSALLVVFGGVTDRLIPLFAVGAFLAFTLSQLGMVVHWRRTQGPHWKALATMNGLGAAATGVTLLIVGVSKFKEGAWLTLLLIPLLWEGFRRMRRYYDMLRDETETRVRWTPRICVRHWWSCLCARWTAWRARRCVLR